MEKEFFNFNWGNVNKADLHSILTILFYSLPVLGKKMLVNGEPFNSSTSYLAIYRELRKVAGIASWFTEFQAIIFPAREFVQLLMLEFFRMHLCCFMSGSFFCFMAGILHSYGAITTLIVLTDTSIVRLIFQRGPELVHQFTFKDLPFISWNITYRKTNSSTQLVEMKGICYSFLG
jgi:hypothetical protein